MPSATDREWAANSNHVAAVCIGTSSSAECGRPAIIWQQSAPFCDEGKSPPTKALIFQGVTADPIRSELKRNICFVCRLDSADANGQTLVAARRVRSGLLKACRGRRAIVPPCRTYLGRLTDKPL
jgi:hypothetical protein